MSNVADKVNSLALAVGLGHSVPTTQLRNCFRDTVAFPAVSEYLRGVGPYFRPKVQGASRKHVPGRKEARETWSRVARD